MVRIKQAAGRVAAVRCHSAVAALLVPVGCHNTPRGAWASCSAPSAMAMDARQSQFASLQA